MIRISHNGCAQMTRATAAQVGAKRLPEGRPTLMVLAHLLGFA